MTLSNVPVVRIGDVADRVTKGTTPTTHGYQYTKDGVAFVRVENLRNGIIDSASLTTFISIDADRFLKRSSLEKGDVLVSIAGTIGRTAVVRQQDLPANTNQAVAIIRGANKTFEPVFLRYALESPLLNRLLTGEARGGAMQNISLEDVKNVEVPVPTIDRQREIVAEIEKQFTRLEAGVAGLRRVQANLKRYRAAVLKAACEGKLVPTEAELARQEGRTYETGPQLLDRILTERRQRREGHGNYTEPKTPDNDKLSVASEGWTFASIDQLVADTMIGLDRGRAQQSKNVTSGVPYIKMNNVTMDGRVLCDDLVRVPASREEATRFAVKDGDVLFNTRNSKELVGKVGIVRAPPVGAIYNNNLMRIRLAGGVSPAFLALQMCSHEFRRRMELVKKATTNVAAVYAKDLLPLAIALPPLAEQTRIVAEVERRLSVVEELESVVNANFQRATRLHQSILQRAFSGQLCPP